MKSWLLDVFYTLGLKHDLISGDGPQQEPGWVYGTMTFDSDLNVTYSTTNFNGQTGSGTMTSQLSIDNDGIITYPSDPSWDLHGVMSDDKKLMVLTRSEQPKDQPMLSVYVKREATSNFSTADLEGTWYIHALTSGDSPQWTGWFYGSWSVDSAGNFSVSVQNSDGDTNDQSGSFTITNDGIVTTVGDASSHGVMSDGKNLIVLTMDDGGGGYNLGFLVKGGGSFSTDDLEGTWYAHGLTSGDSPQWTGWFYGISTVSSADNFEVSSSLDSDGNPQDHSGAYSITSDGIVTHIGATSSHGIMSDDKNLMVFTADDAGGGYHLIIHVKRVTSTDG